jgi:hypothetical protein
MAMEIVRADSVTEWIKSYEGPEVAEVWQRLLDAHIIKIEQVAFSILVSWDKPEITDENRDVINEMIAEGLLTDELFPVCKDGTVIRWGEQVGG